MSQSLKDQIKSQMKDSMRAKDKFAVDTLRELLSAIQYLEMEKKTEALPDPQIVATLQSEMKKQSEALEFAEKAGRDNLADEARRRMAIIGKFLPKQLSENELRSELTKFKEQQPEASMGEAMQFLKANFSGQYDGKMASQIAKECM